MPHHQQIALCVAALMIPAAATADDTDADTAPSLLYAAAEVTPIDADRSDEMIVERYEDLVSLVTCRTYMMDEYAQSYVTSHIDDAGDWGHHALEWKGNRLKRADVGADYFPAQAELNSPPIWDVECSDATTLNNLEKPTTFIYEDSSGSPTDPYGDWICVTDNDAKTGAIVAALGIHYWGSPSYLDVHGYDNTNMTYMRGGVIETGHPNRSGEERCVTSHWRWWWLWPAVTTWNRRASTIWSMQTHTTKSGTSRPPEAIAVSPCTDGPRGARSVL
ncbi:MAG: hypothetical protein AAFV53_11740 [Myxococcota bacterium]